MMTPPVQFEYRLTGTGSAVGQLSVGDSSAIVRAAYHSDALGDLLRAVRSLTEGAEEAQASWWEDVGAEFRWLFAREGTSVRVQVLNVGTIRSRRYLDANVPLAVLTAAIADGARDALLRYGPHGYEEEWVEHPFPAEDLNALDRWVSKQ